MPWKRYVMEQPPDEAQMEKWELEEGWSEFHLLGPCPAKENKPGAKPRMVYIVYLRRSIIVGRAAAGGRLN